MAVDIDRLIAVMNLAVDLTGLLCDMVAIIQRYFHLRYVTVPEYPSMFF